MEIFLVKTERALSGTQIELADYVINPYKGCLTGCLYCYARSNSQIVKIKKQWGEYLYIKENFLDQLKQGIEEAERVDRVLIGSTTEPFQEVESQYNMMESILLLLKTKNIPCVILTKSKEVAEYSTLLTYSRRNKVYITYNSELIRQLFEKNSCPQAERLSAVKKLLDAGIDTILYISPVFPYLTEIPCLFSEIKGRVVKVYWESYNPKLGNWDDLKVRLTDDYIKKIEYIYDSEVNYTIYWEQFVKQIKHLNLDYNYKMEFFIYPYNSYYGAGA